MFDSHILMQASAPTLTHTHTHSDTHHALTIVCGKKQDHTRGIKPANGTASFRNNMEKFYLLRLSFIALKSVVRMRNPAAHWALGILLIKAKTQKTRGSRTAAKTMVCDYDILGENFYLSENATTPQALLHRRVSQGKDQGKSAKFSAGLHMHWSPMLLNIIRRKGTSSCCLPPPLTNANACYLQRNFFLLNLALYWLILSSIRPSKAKYKPRLVDNLKFKWVQVLFWPLGEIIRDSSLA